MKTVFCLIVILFTYFSYRVWTARVKSEEIEKVRQEEARKLIQRIIDGANPFTSLSLFVINMPGGCSNMQEAIRLIRDNITVEKITRIGLYETISSQRNWKEFMKILQEFDRS